MDGAKEVTGVGDWRNFVTLACGGGLVQWLEV